MLRKLEKYELVEEIGHGGMATVYRARDSRLDRLVAVKVMHPHLRAAQEARVRFAREARTVARLKHPNVLEIYDYSGEDSEESYIATELLTGPTLKTFAESQPSIPAEMAACFVVDIARGLAAAHAAGIVHRDVKPENVLIHEDRCVKLTDFGIAQMLDAQSFTVTGQILGSPGHMAPEQIEGGECDARTDVFSLGTVLYFLATGRLPFSGRNPHQVLKRIVEADFADPLRVRPSIGGRLRAIIVRALERQPERRYQSAAEFEAALVAFVAEAGIDDPSAALAEYLADPRASSVLLERRTIESLVSLGEHAAKRVDVSLAHDYFNRVLALDEGNERVLVLLERLGSSSRRRQLGVVVGVSLVILGSAALGYAFLGGRRETTKPPVLTLAQRGASPAGVAMSQSDDERGVTIPGSRRAVQQVRTHGVSDASGAAQRASTAPAVRPGNAVTSQVNRTLQDPGGRGPRERVVVFDFLPRNVSLSIDGSPPRSVGPSYQRATLTTGQHRFRVTGAESCCEDEEWTDVVQPGSSEMTLARRLRFRPARLYVVTNVPADVGVGDGLARARSREVISVPMSEFTSVVAVTATADGYRSASVPVRLRAGALVEAPVIALQAAGAGP